MKQRLGIANALLSPRDLIVLDEPTNGLDPQGTREVRNLVKSLAADGTTIFVSSHLLAEIEQMCTHAAVMNVGNLVAQGSLDELRSAGRTRVEVLTPDFGGARAVLSELGLIVDTMGGTAGAPVTAALREGVGPDVIVAALVAAGVRVFGFSVQQATLEDLFVALTGEGFDVAQ
jgi:ABC-2 type transport system ATP-binding protein